MDKTTHKGNLNAVETVRVTRMTGDVCVSGKIALTAQKCVKIEVGGNYGIISTHNCHMHNAARATFLVAAPLCFLLSI